MQSWALITGASAGIGAVFADQLARRGCGLILVARREARLHKAGRALAAKHGIAYEALAADLATDAGVEAVEARIREHASLDYLVNNAGFGTKGGFLRVEPEVHEQMHRLHVLATVRLTHAALAGMTARGRGAVINVASVAGFVTTPGSASYCATKAWMNTFTESLWLELRGAGSPVRMQALCPGFTYSEFHDVAGIDRTKIPKSLWLDAEYVVKESLAALERDEPVCIPNWRYKALVAAVKWLPKGLIRAATLRSARRMGRT